MTVGVAKAGSAWKVVSASSSLSGDGSLDGKARLRDGQAWQAAAASVGRVRSLAQITRLTGKKQRLRQGWKGFRVAGLGDVQQARQVAFPTVSHGYVPAFETLVLDTQAPSRPPIACSSTRPAGRSSPAKASSTARRRQTEAAAPTTTAFNGELPVQDGGCDAQKGPYTVAATDGVRAIDVFANADTVANDIVLKLFRGTTEVAEADTVRTPERIRYAPDGGVPAGDYFVQVCEFGDGQPPVEPRTYTGTIGFDTSAAPAPYVARWRANPANPPLNPLPADPWNNPSTDARVEHVLEAEHDRVGLRHGGGQPRLALAVGLQPAHQRLDQHDGGQQRALGRVLAGRRPARSQPVPPGQRHARLQLPVDQRVVHQGLRPRARPTGPTSRSARASTSPRRR